MVDKNGTGGTTFGGLSATAGGHAEWWHVTLVDPVGGASQPSTLVGLTVSVQSWDTTSYVDVQVQLSTASDFSAIIFDDVLEDVYGAGFPASAYVTDLDNETTYYWRARPVPDTGEVLPWVEGGEFEVFILSSDAWAQIDFNMGVEPAQWGDAREQIDMNVGIPVPTMVPEAREQIDFNVGFEHLPRGEGWEYIYEYVVTDTPQPHIWFLKESFGRAGDGVEVVGLGFGDDQDDFSGVVEIDYGGDVGWVPVAVGSWQTFPATADGYTIDREIDQVLGTSDPQHTRIGIVIPLDAIPPGYPVRVRTEGP